MSFLRKHKYDLVIALTLLVFAVLFVAIKDNFGFLSDRRMFEDFVGTFGILGPLAVIFSIVLEVIIAPIPGFVPAVSAGFIFGPFEGAVYTYIGNMLGSVLVFLISRHLGKTILMRFVDEDGLEKYGAIIAKRENILLFLYIFPFVPTDIISGAFGLSAISLKKFFSFISVAFLIHVLISNYFGDYLARLYFR
ncbi:MAG: VTT domain-containing protein [Leadbetterella sp.]|nr:VTT domain-containing protein [Leadbetterella sp.]